MDWIGIAIFILFLVFRALGESEKQKKQREARQGRRPTVTFPKSPQPIPKGEGPPPVTVPEWELPPIFSFPLFEEVKEQEIQERLRPESMQEELPFEGELWEAARIIPALEKQRKVEKDQTQEPVRTGSREQRAGIRLEQAMQGIIWSEILQPPRALRPYRPRGISGPY